MAHSNSFIIITSIAFSLLMQGCAFAPKTLDPEAQHAAVERWNRCLQRFEQHSNYYCEGYRRDIIATFPHHMADQVHNALVQQTRTQRIAKSVDTGLGQVFDASDNPVGIPSIQSPGRARLSDL